MQSNREDFIQGCEQELARLEKTYGINVLVEDEKQLRREQMFEYRYGMARLLNQLKNEAKENLICDEKGDYTRSALLARVKEIASSVDHYDREGLYLSGYELEYTRGYSLRYACYTMREHLEKILGEPTQ